MPFVAPRERLFGAAEDMKINMEAVGINFTMKWSIGVWFSPYDISMTTANISWHATTTQTIWDTPHRRASTLMIGNRKKISMKELIPAIKSLLAPQRLTIFAKKNAWKTPLTKPNIPKRIPIVDGDRLRPPYSIGDE
jgi:hypothetical protein